MSHAEAPRTLKGWREARFMEQQEFADFLSVSVFTLRAWEQGRNKPRFPLQRQIAQKLGIAPELILWGVRTQKNLAA